MRKGGAWRVGSPARPKSGNIDPGRVDLVDEDGWHRSERSRAVTDWERVVHDYGPMVFGTAWRILGHTADTEDVVQEVFLEACRLRAKQDVRSWGGLLHRLA